VEILRGGPERSLDSSRSMSTGCTVREGVRFLCRAESGPSGCRSGLGAPPEVAAAGACAVPDRQAIFTEIAEAPGGVLADARGHYRSHW